jgi:hypothetical protein
MIHLLDTHERKTLNFIPDAFPDVTLGPLEVGDWLSYEEELIIEKEDYETIQGYTVDHSTTDVVKKGNLGEFKVGTDVLDWERLRDECYRMRQWQKKNPHVDLHAVWVDTEKNYRGLYKSQIWDRFVSICSQYGIWPHKRRTMEELVEFLKKLDQPKAYVRDVPFMKRSEESTDEAQVFRVPRGVSSELAIKLAECQSFSEVEQLFGRTKKSRKLKHPYRKWKELLDSIHDYYHKIFLETGEEP